jgi:hypothetical protein
MNPTQIMFEETTPTKNQPKAVKMVEQEVSDVESLEPLNVIDLPSAGRFGYPSTIQYRDILAKDEEVLISATSDTYVRVLNGVIKDVLNNPSFFEHMSIYDRDFCLIYLWANNYTPRKIVDVKCKHCNTHENVTVDLTKLDSTAPAEGFKGAMQFDLKSTGKPIKVRLNTVGDEIAVETYLANFEGENKPSFEHLMLVRSIDLGVELPLDKKNKWVGDHVNVRELALIKKFHRKFVYGVNTTLENTCKKCEGVTSYPLPFSAAEIIYPNADLGDMEFELV